MARRRDKPVQSVELVEEPDGTEPDGNGQGILDDSQGNSPETPDSSDEGQPQADEGLMCPRCECRHFEVLYTRPAAGGQIKRRRECRHCRWRVTTFEKIVGRGG